MNKKGIAAIVYVLIFFAIFSVLTIFTWVFIQQMGEDYIINNVADVGREISNSTYADPALTKETIDTLQTNYNNTSIAYDLFFLALCISTMGFSIYSSFKANKAGIFSFFGMIFIGSLLLLLITTYLSSFTSWFMEEIFDRVFADVSLSLPIFYFYLNNLAIINFIWFLFLVGISVIDRQFISRTGQVEE